MNVGNVALQLKTFNALTVLFVEFFRSDQVYAIANRVGWTGQRLGPPLPSFPTIDAGSF